MLTSIYTQTSRDILDQSTLGMWLGMSNAQRIHFVEPICIITFDVTMSLNVGNNLSAAFEDNVCLQVVDFTD